MSYASMAQATNTGKPQHAPKSKTGAWQKVAHPQAPSEPCAQSTGVTEATCEANTGSEGTAKQQEVEQLESHLSSSSGEPAAINEPDQKNCDAGVAKCLEGDPIPPLPLPDGFVEEKFRVDRRKLEQMMVTDVQHGATGEQFFSDIMQATSTEIDWPTKLKIGAKSKKDPHVKIRGFPVNTEKAKNLVLAVLDTKSNRVTLKMDVAHTDHSHIIGKGGTTIKRVMNETGCHIHFPDSGISTTDRRAQLERNNQVTVSGQHDAVEKARVYIRQLLPFVLQFDAPLLFQAIMLQQNPLIIQIGTTNNVQVAFSYQPSQQFGQVIRCEVRSSQSNQEGVAKAAKELTTMLFQQYPYTSFTTMDIAPQHHLFLIGRNGAIVRRVMDRTGATVQFPDTNSIAKQRGSQITIAGSVDAVCKARELLLGCLPLVLMFDVKDEDFSGLASDSTVISKLMESLDVFISIKPMQPKYRVIIKSIERNAESIYKARRCLFDAGYMRNLRDQPAPEPDFQLEGHDWPALSADCLSSLSVDNLQNVPTNQVSRPTSSSGVSRLRRGSLPNVSTSSERLPGARLNAKAATYLPTSAASLRAGAGHLSPINAVSEGTPTRSAAMPRSASYNNTASLEQYDPSAERMASQGYSKRNKSSSTTGARRGMAGSSSSGISDGSNCSLSSGASAPTVSDSPSSAELTWLRPLLTASVESVTCKELPALLQEIGVEAKYTSLFEAEEVDLATFARLTEEDLKEIGVNRFGPRKKLLFAIGQLRRLSLNEKDEQSMSICTTRKSHDDSSDSSQNGAESPSTPPSIVQSPDLSDPAEIPRQTTRTLTAPVPSTEEVVDKYALSPGKHNNPWQGKTPTKS